MFLVLQQTIVATAANQPWRTARLAHAASAQAPPLPCLSRPASRLQSLCLGSPKDSATHQQEQPWLTSWASSRRWCTAARSQLRLWWTGEGGLDAGQLSRNSRQSQVCTSLASPLHRRRSAAACRLAALELQVQNRICGNAPPPLTLAQLRCLGCAYSRSAPGPAPCRSSDPREPEAVAADAELKQKGGIQPPMPIVQGLPDRWAGKSSRYWVRMCRGNSVDWCCVRQPTGRSSLLPN